MCAPSFASPVCSCSFSPLACWAHGIHELEEAAILPIIIEHVWDINPILNEKGALGSFLQALLGYNGNPSLLEAAAYVLYLLGVGALLRRTSQATARPALATA